MVVVIMLGLVMTVVVAAFGAGVRTWEQARHYDAPLTDAVTGLRILERDIRNSPSFYAINYECSETSLSMPAVFEAIEEDGATNRWVGTVRYRFGDGVLLRESWPFPSSDNRDEFLEIIFSGVKEFRFSYLVALPETPDELIWVPTLEPRPDAPRAVRVQLELDSAGGAHTHVHTVHIPNA